MLSFLGFHLHLLKVMISLHYVVLLSPLSDRSVNVSSLHPRTPVEPVESGGGSSLPGQACGGVCS